MHPHLNNRVEDYVVEIKDKLEPSGLSLGEKGKTKEFSIITLENEKQAKKEKVTTKEKEREVL